MAGVTYRGDGPSALVDGLMAALGYARGHDEDFDIRPTKVRDLMRDGLTVSGDIDGVTAMLDRVPGLARFE